MIGYYRLLVKQESQLKNHKESLLAKENDDVQKVATDPLYSIPLMEAGFQPRMYGTKVPSPTIIAL